MSWWSLMTGIETSSDRGAWVEVSTFWNGTLPFFALWTAGMMSQQIKTSLDIYVHVYWLLHCSSRRASFVVSTFFQVEEQHNSWLMHTCFVVVKVENDMTHVLLLSNDALEVYDEHMHLFSNSIVACPCIPKASCIWTLMQFMLLILALEIMSNLKLKTERHSLWEQ